ncbi:MAG: hypothetical protein LBH55_04080 [Mycoplasmataceae bacterium]|nr:hypothetical protein [Mycoplasmataceae bacterium]
MAKVKINIEIDDTIYENLKKQYKSGEMMWQFAGINNVDDYIASLVNNAGRYSGDATNLKDKIKGLEEMFNKIKNMDASNIFVPDDSETKEPEASKEAEISENSKKN